MRGAACPAQGYYREMEKIEELKRAVQFPTLEPPPADFLAQMENYCAEAPRSLDDAVASKKARARRPDAGRSLWSVTAC